MSQNYEQLVTVYHRIFVYCGMAAILFLLIAAALFFLLKIPLVFNELTGRSAKKAVQEMVEEGKATGNLKSRRIQEDGRRHRKKKTKTGKLHSGGLRSEKSPGFNEVTPPTPMGRTPQMDSGAVPPGGSPTGMSNTPPQEWAQKQWYPHEDLQSSGVDMVWADNNSAGTDETTAFQRTETEPSLRETTVLTFRIVKSIVEIHTKEVI